MSASTTITSAASIAVVRRTTAQLGAELPKGIEAGLDEARELRDATAQIEGSAAAVNQRIISLLRNGTDWRADTELQALMFERVAATNGIRVAGVEAAEQITHDTLAQHAEAIITSWAKAIAPDIAALAAAADAIKVDDLAAADVPTLTRRNLVTVWGQARVAVERMHTAADGWGVLVSAINLPRNLNHNALIFAATVTDPTLVGRDVDVWKLARAGCQLSLATPAEYLQRVRVHEAGIQDTRQQYELQRAQDYRRTHK